MANKLSGINRARVLRLLWYSGGISRADMARELALGKSTVTNIVDGLERRGLVRLVESGRSGPAGGRRPLVLAIDARRGYVLGLEIRTDYFKAVATDLQGSVAFSHSQPFAFPEGGLVEAFAQVLDIVRPKLGRIGMPLLGLGLGVAGIVDPGAGVVLESNPLRIYSPVRFYEEAEGLVDVPLLIENDADCCCWGELASRKRGRHGSFIFVLGEFRRGKTAGEDYWGPAVGLGLVLDGRVRHGEGFSAGEFKSLLWAEGNSGQFSLDDAESGLAVRDPGLRSRMILELCAHVALLVNVLNLSCVVIGGEFAEYKAEFEASLRSEIRRNWAYSGEVGCAIEFAAIGDLAVAYGAAGMLLERFFSVPDSVDGGFPGAARRISLLD
jgi:predicted NBD/HSP70 family sugar kinase